jgi:hypothetical protein
MFCDGFGVVLVGEFGVQAATHRVAEYFRSLVDQA